MHYLPYVVWQIILKFNCLNQKHLLSLQLSSLAMWVGLGLSWTIFLLWTEICWSLLASVSAISRWVNWGWRVFEDLTWDGWNDWDLSPLGLSSAINLSGLVQMDVMSSTARAEAHISSWGTGSEFTQCHFYHILLAKTN